MQILPKIRTGNEKDNNLVGIKNSEEFLTNKNPNSPTNRICTSLFSKDRLAFILQYAIAYANETNDLINNSCSNIVTAICPLKRLHSTFFITFSVRVSFII